MKDCNSTSVQPFQLGYSSFFQPLFNFQHKEFHEIRLNQTLFTETIIVEGGFCLVSSN